MNSLRQDSQETADGANLLLRRLRAEGQRREEEGLRAAGTTSLKVTTRFPDYRGRVSFLIYHAARNLRRRKNSPSSIRPLAEAGGLTACFGLIRMDTPR